MLRAKTRSRAVRCKKPNSSQFGMTPVGLGELVPPLGSIKRCSVLCKIRVKKKTFKVIQMFPSSGPFWNLCRRVALIGIVFCCLLAHAARELLLPNPQGELTYMLVTTITWVQSSRANPAASIGSPARQGCPPVVAWGVHTTDSNGRKQAGLAPGKQIKERCTFFWLSSCLVPL